MPKKSSRKKEVVPPPERGVEGYACVELLLKALVGHYTVINKDLPSEAEELLGKFTGYLLCATTSEELDAAFTVVFSVVMVEEELQEQSEHLGGAEQRMVPFQQLCEETFGDFDVTVIDGDPVVRMCAILSHFVRAYLLEGQRSLKVLERSRALELNPYGFFFRYAVWILLHVPQGACRLNQQDRDLVMWYVHLRDPEIDNQFPFGLYGKGGNPEEHPRSPEYTGELTYRE